MTNHTCLLTSGCWITCLLVGTGWWLVASALLWATWNKVIKALFNVKAAKYPQALLLVATLIAFVAPVVVLKKRLGAHHCGQRHGDCPYSADGDGDAADAKAPAKKK